VYFSPARYSHSCLRNLVQYNNCVSSSDPYSQLASTFGLFQTASFGTYLLTGVYFLPARYSHSCLRNLVQYNNCVSSSDPYSLLASIFGLFQTASFGTYLLTGVYFSPPRYSHSCLRNLVQYNKSPTVLSLLLDRFNL
jgi:hypothetical protein